MEIIRPEDFWDGIKRRGFVTPNQMRNLMGHPRIVTLQFNGYPNQLPRKIKRQLALQMCATGYLCLPFGKSNGAIIPTSVLLSPPEIQA